MLSLGSICAGQGGFDLAFDSTGKFKTKWWVEIDKNAQKVLRRHFPNSKEYDDLKEFKPAAGDVVDVIAGGTPCQDLSVAGARGGLDAERSGLFYQMLRVCKRVRPRVILWENVPGVFSSNGGRDFASVLRAFTGLQVEVPAEGWPCAGYVRTPFDACRWSVAWRVLDAQFSNLAQRRERVFLVAGAGGVCPEKILFEPESVCWDSPPSRQTSQRVAPTIESRAGRSGASNFATSGGLAEVAPPIAGVSNGGGANGPGRTADDAEALIPVVALPIMTKRTMQIEETFIPERAHPCIATVQETGRGWWNQSDCAQTVRDSSAGGGSHANLAIIMAHGQANAECVMDGAPSLTCNHEAPIVAKAYAVHSQNSEAMKGNGKARAAEPTEVARALDSSGGFTTGQGGNPVVEPIPFDSTQITSKANYSAPKPGAPCHPLASQAHPPAIAFHGSQDPDVSGEVTHPVGRNQGQETCVAFKASHYTRDKDGAPSVVAPPLSADADKGDQDTLLLACSSKDSGNDVGKDISPTLRAQNFKDSHMNGGGQVAVAFTERTRPQGRTIETQEEVAYALTNPGEGSRSQERNIQSGMEVRRLTPTECLRLQGFSDSWLDGLDLSDSAKYRLVGNSVAVPVVVWIAGRIAIEIARSGAKR